VTCPWCEIYEGFPINGLCSGDLPMVCDRITCMWSLISWPAHDLCSGSLLVDSDRVTFPWCEKISRIFHEWSLFRQLTHGSWLCDVLMIYNRVTCSWFLFRRLTHGSWSGNLLVVWKISRIFHIWSLFGRLALGL